MTAMQKSSTMKKIIADAARRQQFPRWDQWPEAVVARILNFCSKKTVFSKLAPLNRQLYDVLNFEALLLELFQSRCQRKLQPMSGATVEMDQGIQPAYSYICTPELMSGTGVPRGQALEIDRRAIWSSDGIDYPTKLMFIAGLYHFADSILSPEVTAHECEAIWSEPMIQNVGDRVDLTIGLYESAHSVMPPEQVRQYLDLVSAVADEFKRMDLRLRLYQVGHVSVSPEQINWERENIWSSPHLFPEYKTSLSMLLYRITGIARVPDSARDELIRISASNLDDETKIPLRFYLMQDARLRLSPEQINWERENIWSSPHLHADVKINITLQLYRMTGILRSQARVCAELMRISASHLNDYTRLRLRHKLIQEGNIRLTPEQMSQERAGICASHMRDEEKESLIDSLYLAFSEILTPECIQHEHAALWASDVMPVIKIRIIMNLYEMAESLMSPEQFLKCRALLIAESQIGELLALYERNHRYLTPELMHMDRAVILEVIRANSLRIRMIGELYELGHAYLTPQFIVDEMPELHALPWPLNERLSSVLLDTANRR